MKVIQITDDDAKELLESLELGKWRGSTSGFMDEDLQELPDDVRKRLEHWTHRHFHYVVTCWLQKHGADVTK